MAFLIPSDFETQTRKDIREFLTVEDANALKKAERIALDEMKQYLSNRYDIAQIFPDIPLHVNDKSYIIGDYVYFKSSTQTDLDYQVFVCLEDTIEPPTDQTDWQAQDPRNHFIVMLCIDILVYHKYAARNLRTTPQHRIDRYKDALDWLINASTGKNVNVLPAKASNLAKTEFRYGGNDKEEYRY